MTDAGLKELAQFENLATLYLNLTDSRLRVLRELGLLHVLGGAVGQDSSRPHADDEVVEFNLGYSNLTDAGIKELASLKSLAKLVLGSDKGTDASLKHLADFPKLRVLDLQYTNVTDAGLKHLEGLTDLRELSLAHSQVTGAGVFALRKALPQCRITTR